jgi:hypothetical protein
VYHAEQYAAAKEILEMKNNNVVIFGMLVLVLTAVFASCGKKDGGVTKQAETSQAETSGAVTPSNDSKAGGAASPAADFTVTLTNDGEGVVITGYTGAAKAVKIPAIIQEMPVREIGEKAFSQNSDITSVVIPEGVTVIREAAFVGMMDLESVVIPDSVTEIESMAFSVCLSLASVTLPKGLTTLGDYAFSSSNITSITLPSTLTRIEDETFSDCDSLASVTLPSTIEYIGNKAFSGCTALTDLIIPSTVEKIWFASDAFEGKTGLSLVSQAQLKKLGYTGEF